jgi:hypothetical protein
MFIIKYYSVLNIILRTLKQRIFIGFFGDPSWTPFGVLKKLVVVVVYLFYKIL